MQRLMIALALAASVSLPALAGSVTHKTGNSSANAAAASASASSSMSRGDGYGGSVTHNEQKQAPGVSAPSLSASSEACMGSASGGVSVAGFGIAAGSTWANEECQRRLNSQQLRLLGHNDAALAILCTNAGVSDALAAVGKSCPVAKPPRAEVSQPPAATADALAAFCARHPSDRFCRP